MLYETVNYLKKHLSKYRTPLTPQRLFLLLLVVSLMTCCAGLYGISKYQEGLVNKSYTDTTPPDALEPGTGKPVMSAQDAQQYLPGVSKGEIPEGDEDLYILKSQIVPPVCPKCPTVINKCSDAKEKFPPCPPCARCPEPSFECKKVPNYSSSNTNTLPMPLLNDFSQF
jgi:hypothetical protein